MVVLSPEFKPTDKVREAWEPYDLAWSMGKYHFFNQDVKSCRRERVDQALAPLIHGMKSTAGFILDVGSGGGIHFYLPKELESKVIAMDLALPVLRKNTSRGRILADARLDFPFKDQSFDFVTQFFLNRYLENPEDNLAQIARVLKQGGRFILLDYLAIGHPEEVGKFNPNSLIGIADTLGFVNISAEDLIRVHEPSAQNTGVSSHDLHMGPLYLFTGIKT